MNLPFLVFSAAILFAATPVVAGAKCSKKSAMPGDQSTPCQKEEKKEADCGCPKKACDKTQTDASEEVSRVKRSAAQKVVDGQ